MFLLFYFLFVPYESIARGHANSSQGKFLALPLFYVTVLWKCPFCYESCLLIKRFQENDYKQWQGYLNHLLIAVLNLEKIFLSKIIVK